MAFGISIFTPIVLLLDAFIIGIIVGVLAGIGFFIYMMWEIRRQEREESTKTMQNQRAYHRQFAIAMGSYVAILMFTVYLLDHIEAQPIRMIVAILPMLPVLYGLWGYMEWIRNLDELQQKIQLEAIAFSMGLTGVITFTWGFLSGVGVPPLHAIWVFPMMIVLWGIGQFVAQRRYA
ncbi:MAG: hypothetical protein AAF846_00215 [Chloroflexota bacterium]